MASIDDLQPLTSQRLQLLKMAQEMLFHEYIDKKAQLHNQWSAESDVAWRTRGVRLPYPTFPPYPTQGEIVAKALELDRFLSAGSAKIKEHQEQKVDDKKPETGIKESPIQVVEVTPVEVKTDRDSIVPEILQKNDYFSNVEPAPSSNSLFSSLFKK